MDIILQKIISAYAIILLVLSVFLFVIKIIRHLVIATTISTLVQSPDDKRERIIHLYRKIISTYRIALWMIPFSFFLFLALLALLFIYPELVSALPDVDLRQFVMLMGISLIVAYIHFVEDAHYKKKILTAMDKSIEREIS
jgi:hypothetical protein